MSTRNTDVNLIVRARTEGEKAIAGLSDILATLFDDTRQGSDDIAALGKTLGALDRAATSIAGSMQKAGGAVDRQRASLAENNAAYAALLKQQAEAQRVMASFGDQQNKGFVGPRTKAFTEQFAGVRAEVDRLGTEINRTFAKIGTQAAQLDGSRSALLNLSSSSTAVAEAQRQAEAQIELTNQALAEQAAAAERVTDIQRRINRVNGVDRPDATGRAASVADLLAAADAEFRRKEAAEAEAAALRLVNNQLAERANLEAALQRNTGLGRGPAADGGATTSRLAELSREIDKKEDAARAERDLAAAARATNSALAERANIERALERNTGVGRIRAIDSGATVSALTELVNEQHRAAEAIDQMDKEAEHLRATLDPMAAIQERFNTRLARFKELARAGKIEAHELAAAEEHLAIEANRAREALEGVGGSGGNAKHKIGLFGLKPYELQNLSYQVNDVVTGLASGQKATQVIAQQGGQILQLFPRVAGNLIGAMKDPRIAALVVTVGALFLGMKKAADEAARLRELSGQISFRADGNSYDPKKLAEGAEALQRMGVKAADATAAVKVLLNEAINPDLLNTFSRAARNTAEVLGTDLPTAARQLADAFTGGFDAVAALDDKLNFLTASEREHIKSLFDSGNAEAARTEALAAYSRQAEEAANKQRGPWAKAALSLGNAWKALLDFIANSAPVKITIAVLNELAGAVKSVGDAIAGALKDDTVAKPSTANNIARVQGEIATLEKKIADYESAIAKKAPASGTFMRLAEFARGQLDAARAELKKLEQQAPDTLNNDPNGVEAKKRSERLSEINTEESLQQLRQRGQAGLSRADGLRRAQMAGEVAYRREMAATGDAIVAARLREIAVAKEQGDIDKQNEAARKAAERERERQERERARLAKQTRFVDPVDGRISSGFGPRSSPGGVGSKFHRGIDYAVPTGTSVRAPAAGVVIETGYDAKLGKYVLIDHGNKTQSKFGHLSDNSIVREGQTVTQGQQIAKSGNTGTATTGAHLHYTVLVNGKPVDPRKGIFVGDGPARFEVNQGEALQDYEDALDDRQHRQDNFNLSVRHEFEERQRIIKQLAEQQGLTGAALLAEQRRQEQLAAEAELRADVENANKNLAPGLPPITISEDVIARARDLAGALFDLRSAREALDVRLDTVERPIENLEQQRNVLVEQRDLLRSIGEFKAAAAVDRDIQALTGSIGEAYDKLIEFYRALSPADRARLRIADDAQLEAIILKLTRAKDAATKLQGSLAGGTISFRAFLESFASSATDSFNNFFRRVAEGQNVFRSAGRAIKEFAASFTGALAQMIVKALAFAAAMYVLSAITGLSPNALAQAMQVSAGVHHTGGIAGSAGGVKRTVSPEAFRNAMRYHQGGVIGFAPDEVPAILERGEEVLPRGDPRHRANGGLDAGRGGDGVTTIKNVNLFDREQAAQELLNTKAGEKAVLNIIRGNRRGLGLNG